MYRQLAFQFIQCQFLRHQTYPKRVNVFLKIFMFNNHLECSFAYVMIQPSVDNEKNYRKNRIFIHINKEPARQIQFLLVKHLLDNLNVTTTN